MKHQMERDPFAACLLEWSNRTGSITNNGNSVGRAETLSDTQAGWSGRVSESREISPSQGNQKSITGSRNEAGVITRKHKHG